MKETIDVRPGEELPKKELELYIRSLIKEIPEGDLIISQFPTGHSNLTYLLKIGDWEAVLRRPPLGPVAPKAHDMKRESAVMSSLHPYFPPVPKPFCYCSEESIIGSPFFLMERKKGIVLDTEFPDSIMPTAELGRRISEQMVDQLVHLHQIDYQETELIKLAKPNGFLERQVGGWINRYERSKTSDLPGVTDLTNWLVKHQPLSQKATVIHYDYKLNNTMFSSDNWNMVGLFDWEMATVGDPLADVGVALSYWIEHNDPIELKQGFGKPPVTVLPGFFTRAEWAERYAKKSGRDISDLHYYITFAYFKLAVIAQQIYYRFHKGQTQDPRFARLNQTVAALIGHARQTAATKLS
ncbi:phosphotransferase family protein [Halalkalibacter akibai]|uniref:Aminoglycoside phosphotransferase n=1 Tax=Halalkalibacter akibai (strain ATCC 43226 / DSM 21942 / CIP 109018 / JCM 9157 / 1139) TaxID=1236973 RepID=W4QNY8_HALA3|nr:phosphotransferase family protein [Halalkalibacter akibai]GAE33378.1 aminoglycoside phosphotransferase [Halalkalibacter akibai JCM 9157]